MGDKTNYRLLHKLAENSASDAEREEFQVWLTTLNADQYKTVLEDYEDILNKKDFQKGVNLVLLQDINLKVEEYQRSIHARKKKTFLWMSVAASLLIVASITLILQLNAPARESYLPLEQPLSNEISPGKNQAYLEFEDGVKIALDEFASKNILERSGIIVERTENGQLLYNFEGKVQNKQETIYHTIATPNGGEYQIVLPDGTKVWLNAASRLKFPTVFEGDVRRVELIGEAYFDVVSNKKKPFIVDTQKESVKVLGTQFNINSYSEEQSSKTTLIEGEVEVSAIHDINLFKILKPGEQSVILGNSIQVVKADLDEAVAWKNGEFMFNRESIESVMRKIARWYDVEVIYSQPISSDVKIWGSISRFDNFSEVLKFIERTKTVYFKVEGRRVYVMR